uniref:Uncharacterized protein n=1 Tax=Nelumbo nucifera TaxID=4432 RepID=A0A822YIX6_NELNU|nr:TPA_asm: hypothetical protein HUJ06_009766 [Nelumbo nucifera]
MCGSTNGSVESYSPTNIGNPEPLSAPFPAECNDNFWIMDDLWAMQLLNSD